MEVSKGTVIDERYVVEAPLGQGGMASVWRVRHAQLGTPHALKLLYVDTPKLRERLLDEGRIQAMLSHPNVVKVTDVVSVPTGVGLVMDWVQGPTLRALIKRGLLPLETSLPLCAAVLDGVAHAHAAGLIHRDLKPENILLEPDGDSYVPRVADFGLAKALNRVGPGRTRSQIGMGTPGYMAPEQHRDAAKVDARADVFSLGCVLFEVITGERPFDGFDMLTLYQQALQGDFTPPEVLAPGLPLELGALLSQSLRPRPEERLPDAIAFAQRWRAAAGLPPGPPVRVERQPVASQPPAATISADTFELPLELDGPEAPTRRVHNLRPPRDSFVGRADDLHRLGRLFADGASLITVLGPGGAGKTRLSQELGRASASDFAGGVWFCDLSEARTLEGVCFSAATALDLRLSKGDPVAQIGHALAGRGRTLLVLDNFEQVVELAPETLARWRDAAPEAVFLVTSRSVLSLPGEQVFHLATLPEGPAVALFTARARARKPSFELTPENAEAVAALVRLLDGLPLAIELAAARAALLTPSAMVARMNQRFRLLRGGQRGSSARQMTLKGAIDWSWELLEDWEQAAFAQSSVFEDGFTLEAAEAVLDLSAFEGAPWPMDAVRSLLDKSLIRALVGDERRPGEPRFGMYLSLREYAAGELEAPAPFEARHGAYYAGFGQQEARANLDAHGGAARWWALSAELDNLGVAVRRAAARGDAPTAARAALAVAEVLGRRGPFSLAIEHLEIARSALTAPSPMGQDWRGELAEVQGAMGHLFSVMNRMEDARECLEEALTLHRALGDRRGEGVVLGKLGNLQQQLSRTDEAKAHYEAALALHRAVGDRQREGVVLGNLGSLYSGLGRLDEARERLEAALAIHRAVGNRVNEGSTQANLGILHAKQGRLEEAAEQLQAALRVYQEVGDRRFEGMVLANLGIVYGVWNRKDEALTHYEAALTLHRELGNRGNEGSALMNLGNLRSAQGQLDEARENYETSLAISRALGDTRSQGNALGNLGLLHMNQGRPDEAREAYESALAIHREVGNRRNEGIALGNLGLLQLNQGRLDEAREHLEAALTIQRALNYRYGEATVLCNLGLLCVKRDLLDEAQAYFEDALLGHREARVPQGEGITLAHLGALRVRRGDVEGGRAAVAQGETLLRTSGADPLTLGLLLAARGPVDVETGHLQAAREALEELESIVAAVNAGPRSELGAGAATLRQRLSAPER